VADAIEQQQCRRRWATSCTDAGGKTSTSTRSVVVSPPATVGGGCVLTLSQSARVTATLLSHSCTAIGNEVVLTAPITQTLFADGCTAPINAPVVANGGIAFPATRRSSSLCGPGSRQMQAWSSLRLSE